MIIEEIVCMANALLEPHCLPHKLVGLDNPGVFLFRMRLPLELNYNSSEKLVISEINRAKSEVDEMFFYERRDMDIERGWPYKVIGKEYMFSSVPDPETNISTVFMLSFQAFLK